MGVDHATRLGRAARDCAFRLASRNAAMGPGRATYNPGPMAATEDIVPFLRRCFAVANSPQVPATPSALGQFELVTKLASPSTAAPKATSRELAEPQLG